MYSRVKSVKVHTSVSLCSLLNEVLHDDVCSECVLNFIRGGDLSVLAEGKQPWLLKC